MSASASASARSSNSKDEERIGDYTLGREIGKGSFATVFKGYRIHPREPVAIKVVTRKKLTAKLLENLEGEIAILKAINHPNVVELKDCLKTDSHIYLIMAFCSAGDLSLYIKKGGHLPSPSEPVYNDADQEGVVAYPHPVDGGLNETVVRSFLAQLAAALEFMRKKNIVHRDIKPQNLLLQPPDSACVAMGHPKNIPQLKVADFGFARSLPAASLAETLCGSPLYMAPEILRYEKYDAKADLWSVGAVLYEMSVGKPPFRANNHVELLRKIERGEDRIKFPDERSAGSLAREAARREEAGEAPLPPPHHVGEDIKDLIRRLLKRKPVERMSFEEFFRSPVIEAVALGAAKPAEEREHEDESRPQVGASRDAQEGGAPAPPQLAPAPRIASKSEQGERTPNSPISVPTETVLPESGVEPSHPRSEADPREGPSSASGAERSSQSPSPRAGPSPLPTFTSKYVVGGQRPAFAREGSGLNRRGSRQDFGRQPSYEGPGEPSSLEDNVLTTPSSSMTNLHTQPIVAAANDEDSLLGKEYVMIEKRNVEVNALADELAASPQQRNFSLARRPSRLSRLSSGLGSITPSSPLPTSSSTSTSTSEAPVRPGISPPIGPWPVAAPFALPPGSRPSSFPRRTSLSSSGSPSPRLTTQEIGAAPSSSTQKNGSGAQIIGGADEAAQRQVVPASPSSGSPSSALARAISMASVRLFGVPSGMSLRGAAALVRSRSTRRAALIRSGDYPDAAEAGLLATLEDLGQKSFVLTEFADSKLAAYFPVGPHQPSDLDSSAGGGSLGRSASGGGGGAVLPSPSPRRTASTSSVLSAAEQSPAEIAAAEALVLYVKSLSFLQRGIDATRTFLDARSRPGAPASASADVTDVVQWLRARFNDGYDKADFARGKCGEIPESAQHVDKLIFDKALEIARAAALDELENNREDLGWDPDNCLLAYETALSMLHAVLDTGDEAEAGSGSGLGLNLEDQQTIDKFVRSISKRLAALQSRVH